MIFRDIKKKFDTVGVIWLADDIFLKKEDAKL